jgi:hypothetical protein
MSELKVWSDKFGQLWEDRPGGRLELVRDEHGQPITDDERRMTFERVRVEHQNGPLSEVSSDV